MTEGDRLAEIQRRVKAVNDYGEPYLKEFIIHAGEDVIWLLDYIEELQRERDALTRRLTRQEAYAEMAEES